MRLDVIRPIVGVVATVVVVTVIIMNWHRDGALDRYRERVLELCGSALAGIADDRSPAVTRRALAEEWHWGFYELPSRPFADELSHGTDRFEAVRVSRHERLPDAEGDERRCRMSLCVYSIALDRVSARVTDRRCGGAGVTEAVTPALRPDILQTR